MIEVAAPIAVGQSSIKAVPLAYNIVYLHATLAPDERHIVLNDPLGEVSGGAGLMIVDLERRLAEPLVGVSGAAAREVYGVSYNSAERNFGLLAINRRERIDILRLVGSGRVEELSSARIAPFELDPVVIAGSIEWSTDGSRIITASDARVGFAIFEVQDDGNTLEGRGVVAPCTRPSRQLPDDVLTLNHWVITSTPTTVDVPTSTATLVTSTWTAAPTESRTALPTGTSTPRPAATPTPVSLYLPLALGEQCTPGTLSVDVALVIDASTTMRRDLTTAGRTKLEAAIEAATFFVREMSLPSDQAAVVVFNDTAEVVQPLTGRRADVELALRRIPWLVREQTRIDLGITKAHGELMSVRRNPVNDPVLILLTDGLANPVPASVAVQRADGAKAVHITIFTIGRGQATALNVVELAQMASRPEYFYRAPDGEDLQGIYRTIAVEIPCPASQYWGGR
jgi:hypothetical protein